MGLASDDLRQEAISDLNETLAESSVLVNESRSSQAFDTLSNFIPWLGVTSWDYQSFFAGRVGGRAAFAS
jgi:hypothetical protein